MAKFVLPFLTLLALSSLATAPGAQPTPACRVEPFQGATLPQGAVAHMKIFAVGASCSIRNWGVPSNRMNPAHSGSITLAPAHGTASFAAPDATYTPEPGFVGNDEFAYDALAKGNLDQQVRLRVRVRVEVAPGPR